MGGGTIAGASIVGNDWMEMSTGVLWPNDAGGDEATAPTKEGL